LKSLLSRFILIVSIAVLVSSCAKSDDSSTSSTDNTTSSSDDSSDNSTTSSDNSSSSSDTTAPTVTSISTTADNQSAVSITDNITVTFSEAMDNTSVTTNTDNSSCYGTLMVSSNNFSNCVQMASPNKALDFDGTNDYVAADGVTSNLDSSTGLPFTVSAWAYPDTTDNGAIWAFNKTGNSDENLNLLFYARGGSTKKFYHLEGGNNSWTVSTNTFEPNNGTTLWW